jgi:predicted HicB family RNase H-like nuclease
VSICKLAIGISFVVRIPPEIYRKLAIEAEEEGISLNRLVSEKLNP